MLQHSNEQLQNFLIGIVAIIVIIEEDSFVKISYYVYSNFQINNAHILGHNGPLDICSVQKTNLYQHIIAGKNFQHTTRPNFFFFSLLHKSSASSNQMRYIYMYFLVNELLKYYIVDDLEVRSPIVKRKLL